MNFQVKTFIALLGLITSANISYVSAQNAAGEVVLNGMVAIFDDRRAFFTIPSAGNFSLAEGESRFGIKLLSIDFPSRCVRIADRGEVRWVRICAATELFAVSRNASRGNVMNPDGTPNISTETSLGSTSTTVQNHTSIVAGTAGASNSSVGNNDGSGNVSSRSTNENQQVYQWWIQEAQKIEHARIETADRVAAGKWPPYPLTPLTPPGTPAQLVSGDSVFMDHGPGVVVLTK
jgi:hypothetical protein